MSYTQIDDDNVDNRRSVLSRITYFNILIIEKHVEIGAVDSSWFRYYINYLAYINTHSFFLGRL